MSSKRNKLTDFVTAKDVCSLLIDAHRSGKLVEDFSMEILTAHDPELFALKAILARFGFPSGETGALLSILDAAIQHKVTQ